MSCDTSKAGIKAILIRRDGMSPAEADERIEDCQNEINEQLCCDGGDTVDMLLALEETIAEHFGLEPDYLTDFLPC